MSSSLESGSLSPNRLVVVGASAGGVEALMGLAASLPAGFPAPVCIVLHMPSNAVSTLSRILARAGPNPAVTVQERTSLRPGTLYVARPDRHLVVEAGFVFPVSGPRENRHRPAVDPLFRSAVAAYGRDAIGVVLTGGGDDGAAGLLAIRRAGGIGIVQDPNQALAAGMPSRALEAGAAHYRVPLADLATLLTRLLDPSTDPAWLKHWRVDGRGKEKEVAEESPGSNMLEDVPGAALLPVPWEGLAGFTCPECGGRIWEAEEQGLLQFRCRVGHAYTADTFLNSHTEALEGALWSAVNALEENVALTRRMADRARERRHDLTARRLDEKALDTEQQAGLLRGILERSHRTDQLADPIEPAANPEADAPQHVNVIGDAGAA